MRVLQVCFVLQEADLVLLARVSGGRRSVGSVALDAAVALLCVVRSTVLSCNPRACLHRQTRRLRFRVATCARRRCRLQTPACWVVCMLPHFASLRASTQTCEHCRCM